MKTSILIVLSMILLCGNAIAAYNYIIDNNTVYIDDSKVYLSATPHTLSSSGWVYFNLTSKVYTGNIDACWGFNTSVSKPKKAEVYSPHWVNTTTNHEKIFYNPSFVVYAGDDLNYGNSYNTNYKYTVTETINNDNGTVYITNNVAFDSFDTDGTNYTVYWHNRHDNYYLWKDFSSSFNSVIYNYEGFNKWYYIKNVPIISNKKYTVRTWIDVPVSTKKQFGKYYFAIKPSGETISQAVNNGHFYNLDPWWNVVWNHRKEIILTGGASGVQTDYQLLLNVTYDSDMQSDFDDLRFCNETHKLDAWLESKVDSSYALVWVEFPTTPANGVNQTYYMYYGNAGAASAWDIGATMLDGDDFLGASLDAAIWDSQYCNTLVSGGKLTIDTFSGGDRYAGGIKGKIAIAPICIIEAKMKQLYTTADCYAGLTKLWDTDISNDFQQIGFMFNNKMYGWNKNDASNSFINTAGLPVVQEYKYKIVNNGSTIAYTYDGTAIIGSPQSSNLPNENMYLRIAGDNTHSATTEVDWIFVRKYAANPPTYAFGSEGFYADSIHYNTSKPYNHTIKSDGTIIVNRSIIATDDINWTAAALTDDCNLVVTKYNLSDVIIANFTLYTSSLNWLTVSDLINYTYYNLSFSNGTLIEKQYTNSINIAYFTTNLTVGTYIIEKSIITQYYVDSIHYNTSNPYNHTIKSDGIIIANHSIIITDDINWIAAALTDDCHLIVTEYNLSDVIIANFTLYTSSLNWLTVPDLIKYTYYNLSFSNGTLIEKQYTDSVNIAYFTTNLTVGTYIIEKGASVDPFRENAYCFYDEMRDGLTDFRDSMGKYLVWGILFFAVGLAFTIFTKIKMTLMGGK